jgi:hypothetical protein
MDAQRSGSSALLLMAFREIEYLIPLKKPFDKTRIFWTLFEGQAFSCFDNHLRRSLLFEDIELTKNDLIEIVLRDICL